MSEDVLLDEHIDLIDGPEVEARELAIPAELHGERLDRALAVLLPEFSRSYSQQLLSEGCVSCLQPLARVMTKASAKVRMGERYQLILKPTPQSQAFKPEDIPLHVIHEDEDLRVIFKPAGLVVHPAPGNWSGTLLNGLLALDPQAVMLPRAGIVHRLDKDTSGLMIVARTRRAMDALVAMIAGRHVHREYLAVAYRKWNGGPVRDVVAAIGRDYRNRLRMAVVDLERLPGKEAHTTFECLSSQEEACLVQCTLHTGRTHQIRVHMAHFGHPLVGDSLYAGPMTLGIDRQALHAFRLSFDHPITGELLKFEAPLPNDMVNLLAGLNLKRPE
ncbi:RluA family pseudouridine synthase [Limnohabitans sp.]|uniref:RluA family pseudouridine synthase n=1 Tax=Limnohabitans sp. TaxID=1907725 RepID=UPI00286FABA9|nr:RluA family pseudouridine synthase [Limnohabitans sp.]